MTDTTSPTPPAAASSSAVSATLAAKEPAARTGRPPVLIGRSWQIAGIALVALIVGGWTSTVLPMHMAIVAGLTVLSIGLWATAVVPEYWTALGFFLIAMVFSIAPADVVFSGFRTSTFWLLFSGIILGAATRHTGLGKRAAIILARMLGHRYPRVISGIVVFGLGLSFIVPSSVGRVMLLLPIIVALAEHMGYDAHSNGRTGMLLAATFSTFLPAFAILPSNVPNMILAGMTESLYGRELAYGDYLLLHFPVLGLLKAALLIPLILLMFPDRDPQHDAGGAGAGPMSGAELRLAGVFAVLLLLWITDGVHHISPGWVGLAGALYALWPSSGLTSKKCINEEVNYASLFFVVGIMGLGAVISASGLGNALMGALSGHAGFSPDRPVWDVAVLTGISTLVGMATSLPGIPAVLTPLAKDLAEVTGLSLTTILMTQVLAFSNVFLPYQAPPLITAMHVGQLRLGAMAKLSVSMFVLTLLVLTPLDFLWWHLLGLL